MSLGNLVHLGYIPPAPQLFQPTGTICTDAHRLQSAGGTAGTSTGSLYTPRFLTKMPTVRWACNQGLYTYLLPTSYTMEAPQKLKLFEKFHFERVYRVPYKYTENRA